MKKVYQIGSWIFTGVILLFFAYGYREHRIQENISKEILRFHVIANSDSKEDQKLKLKVRDAVGNCLTEELCEVKDLAECEERVNNHLAQIENCAREVIAKEGYNYSVKALVTNADFPTKTYGNYTFPKGNYKALRVIIGEGNGRNWWCVMYPNLCFSSSLYKVDDENSKIKLGEVLEKEELDEIVAKGKIHVKFKYFDALLR